MNKAFSMFLWENDPSTKTPMSAENLNRINVAMDIIDNRVVEMEMTKASQADMLTAITDVSVNRSTGVITFTKKNGATEEIDTLLEKLAINFAFDIESQRLIITLDDGTVQYVDLKALITELEFLNSNTVLFSVTDGKVSASIAKGSITADMLEPNYFANIQLYASQALASAQNAKESEDNAKASADEAKSINESSKTVLNEAKETLVEINKKVTGTSFYVNFETGKLEYESPNYDFKVNNSNGKLEWEVA